MAASTVEPTVGRDFTTRVPSVGMEFDTIENACSFYNEHAKFAGFEIRKQNSKRDKGKESVLYMLLVCNKEGLRKERMFPGQYEKPATRTGCMARMRVNKVGTVYKVTELCLEHNHQLATPSHKKSGSRVKRMSDNAEGCGNLESQENDADDYIEQERRLELKEGDSQALLEYFRRMQQDYDRFYYTIELDLESHLKHVFWVDARSRAAYEFFGDVVTLDTTFLTNKCDLKCLPFVGVNHHGQSILFGCGLVVDETKESFIWLFNAFLEAMGCAPNAIITDQCQEIGDAIKEVFPNTNHRLCTWHILKKIPEKLGTRTDYDIVKGALKKAVYNSLMPDEFDKEWESMIKENNLEGNEWLKQIYDIRGKWVPAFVKKSFLAGVSSTQRSERIDVFFDGYANKKTSLKEFINQYEVLLERTWHQEEKADFDSYNTSPILKIHTPYEVQVSKLYTRAMFVKFQEELMGMLFCSSVRTIYEDGSIRKFIVRQNDIRKQKFIIPARDYEVIFNRDTMEVDCVCCLFQHRGYLCKHALYVFNINDVVEIPSWYILARWRKDFKHTYVRNYHPTNVRFCDTNKRAADLFRHLSKLAAEGGETQDGYEIVMSMFYEALENIRSTQKVIQHGASTSKLGLHYE